MTTHIDRLLDADQMQPDIGQRDLVPRHRIADDDDLDDRLNAADLTAPLTNPSKIWWRRLLRLGESRDELAVRGLIDTINTDSRDVYTVVVLGGSHAGKTTWATVLGSIFAEQRSGDPVVAIDMDPANGTLADRINPAALSVRKITETAHIERHSHIRGQITRRNRVGLEVASCPDRASSALTAEEFVVAYGQLARFYGLLIVDCGVNLKDPSMPVVLAHADSIVMVSSVSAAHAKDLDGWLHWLRANDFEDLLQRLVLVLNHTRPANDRTDRKSLAGLVESLTEHFETKWVGIEPKRLFINKWDRHLARADVIDTTRVDKGTYRRALQIAAAVATGFSAK